MRQLACVGVFMLFAACGGNLATDPDDGASSSGSSGSSSGASSGSSGASSGSSGGGDCTNIAVNGNRACVPGTAAAKREITVQIDDTQGCIGCFTTVNTCTVIVNGGQITLGMSGKQCTPKGDVGCPAICGIPKTTCAIPPLAPGKYIVQVTGEDSTGYAPRELVVEEDASETSCSLLQNGTPVPELDKGKYGVACASDLDCRLATFGNLCQPCACPNGAISVGASDAYEADHRALRSHCPGQKGIACAACAPMKAKCELDGSSLEGTCKVVSDL
jgi:hypothetical protein